MANRHLTACAHSSAGQPRVELSPLDVFLIAEHSRRAVHLLNHVRAQAGVASDSLAFEGIGLAIARLQAIINVVDPQAAEGKGGGR